MIDVTSNEFKQQVRSYFFNNPLIKSGIIHVVDEPFETTLKCSRYQSWSYDRFPEMSTEAAADRIGEYFSRQMTNFFSSVFVGVAGSDPLPEDTAERNNYRLAQVSLFQDASKKAEHPIALVPSSLKLRLEKQSLLSYHLCPFTQTRIPSYEGKRLVPDDSCVNPYLFYPGELKVFFGTPAEEVKLDPDDSSIFSYWREYSVSVNGFEYTKPTNPTNYDVANPDCWKRTTEKSQIMRVG